MKINEASVIDNKVIDELIAEIKNKSDHIFITESLSIFIEGQLSMLQHIKSHLKPLEPILRDAYRMGRIDIRGIFANKYINENEI